MSKENRTDHIEKNPNIIAYKKDLKEGVFVSFEPGTYVAYSDGKLVGFAKDIEQLFRKLSEKGIEGFYFDQVNVTKHKVYALSPIWTEKS